MPGCGSRIAESSGASLRGVRILLCLVSYDLEQQVHLERMLEDVRDMCEAGARPKVRIYTTVAWPTPLFELVASLMFCSDLGGTVPFELLQHARSVKHNLTNFHRKDMYSQLDQFDLFIYAEGDLALRPATAAAFLAEERALKACEGEEVWRAHIPAFLRFEYNVTTIMDDSTRKKMRQVTRVFWEQRRPLDTLSFPPAAQLPSWRYRIISSPHTGLWMATRAQLQWWRSSCRFDVVSRVPKATLMTQRVWMAGRQLFDPRFGCAFVPLLPLRSYQAFTVHHLANKNFLRVIRPDPDGRKRLSSGKDARLFNTFVEPMNSTDLVSASELNLFVQAARTNREAPGISWTPVHIGWSHTHMVPSVSWRCGPRSALSDVSCGLCDVLLNTRKYDKRCQTALPQRLYPLLVTGTGGTGTNMLVHMLKARGVSTGHEDYGEQATVSWMHGVSDAYLGKAYPVVRNQEFKTGILPPPMTGGVGSADSPRFRFVVHLVRCPLDAIAYNTYRYVLTMKLPCT